MKFSKLLAAVVTTCTATTVFAQRGFDTFGVPRAIVLTAPAVQSGGTAGTVSNNPVDIRSFDGIVKIDVYVGTNTGTTGGTVTITPNVSSDLTNWSALSSFAFINKTNQIISTNGYYGSGVLYATNNYLIPGTITTPTAASAGFATKYITTPLFTNTAGVSVGASGWYEIGFNAGDAPRYISVQYVPGGSATNFNVGAVLTGYTHDTTFQ